MLVGIRNRYFGKHFAVYADGSHTVLIGCGKAAHQGDAIGLTTGVSQGIFHVATPAGITIVLALVTACG